MDAVTRLAVAGLRKAPYSYSWSEIADRLGVSKQAAQMRYGDRTDRAALDRRLLEAGLHVSVATLRKKATAASVSRDASLMTVPGASRAAETGLV